MQKSCKFMPFFIFLSARILLGMEASEYQKIMQDLSKSEFSLYCEKSTNLTENSPIDLSNISLDLDKEELIDHLDKSSAEELSGKYKDGIFTLKKPFLAIAFSTGPEYGKDTVTLYNLTTKNNLTMLMQDIKGENYCLVIQEFRFNDDCSKLIMCVDLGKEYYGDYETHAAPMMILKNKLSLDQLRGLRDRYSEDLNLVFNDCEL